MVTPRRGLTPPFCLLGIHRACNVREVRVERVSRIHKGIANQSVWKVGNDVGYLYVESGVVVRVVGPLYSKKGLSLEQALIELQEEGYTASCVETRLLP